jgi:hypothetical protein
MRKDKISKGTSLENPCRQLIIAPIHSFVVAGELEGYFTVIDKGKKGRALGTHPPIRTLSK